MCVERAGNKRTVLLELGDRQLERSLEDIKKAAEAQQKS